MLPLGEETKTEYARPATGHSGVVRIIDRRQRLLLRDQTRERDRIASDGAAGMSARHGVPKNEVNIAAARLEAFRVVIWWPRIRLRTLRSLACGSPDP